MNTKTMKYEMILLLWVLLAMTPVTAQAGSAARHRWEGAAIGFGVGTFLAGVPFFPPPPPPVVVGPVPVPVPPPYPGPRWAPGPPPPRDRDGRWDDDRHRYGRHHHYDYDNRGHWETRRVWVPPVFEDSYREGHYNRWGEWVPGHWERTMARPGFWREERYWVRR